MSESRFSIDISFLCLFIRSIRDQIVKKSQDEILKETESQMMLADEINSVFQLIKTRNFRECEIDPNYLIFSYNADDEMIDL